MPRVEHFFLCIDPVAIFGGFLKIAHMLYLAMLVGVYLGIFFSQFIFKIHSVFIPWELRHDGMTSPQAKQSPEVSSTDLWILPGVFKCCIRYVL